MLAVILPSERCQGQVLEYWAEDFYFQKNLLGGSSSGPWAYERGGTGGYCSTDADCVGRDTGDSGRIFGFANWWTGAPTSCTAIFGDANKKVCSQDVRFAQTQTKAVLDCACPGSLSACDGSSSIDSNRARPSNQDLIAAVVAIKDAEQDAFDAEVVRIARTLDAILSADP